MVWWPQHSLQPNLLTHCVLERAKLPQSVLSELYVRVAAGSVVADRTKAARTTTSYQRLTVPITVTPVDGTAAGTRSLEAESHPPAAPDASGRITSVEEIMKLGVLPARADRARTLTLARPNRYPSPHSHYTPLTLALTTHH